MYSGRERVTVWVAAVTLHYVASVVMNAIMVQYSGGQLKPQIAIINGAIVMLPLLFARSVRTFPTIGTLAWAITPLVLCSVASCRNGWVIVEILHMAALQWLTVFVIDIIRRKGLCGMWYDILLGVVPSVLYLIVASTAAALIIIVLNVVPPFVGIAAVRSYWKKARLMRQA